MQPVHKDITTDNNEQSLRQQLAAEVARREQAEQLAAARDHDLAEFVDNAAEGIHRVGPDGTILWANKAELAMLGYDYDEYVGRHIADFHVDAPVIETILHKLLDGETLYDQPARLRCRDGSIRHVLIHSNGSFEDGQLRYTRCFTRDATARHERDMALAQRDQMLLRAPVATALVTGAELRFQLVNGQYAALVRDPDLQGKTFAEAFPHECDGAFHRLLQQAFATGTGFAADEWCYRNPERGDGEWYFRLSLEPLRDAAGATESIVVVCIDVTEHVQARKKLEQARDERETLLGELTAANRNKDQFLAMLGHELRNPLAPIVMALEIMERRGEPESAPQRALIRRQVEHLVRLVDDLLDIARVTQGKVELQAAPVAVAQVIDSAVEIASAEIAARQHVLQWQAGPALFVDGDAARLAQVIANLLINAARYTPPGGAIRVAAGAVIGRGAGEIRIVVTDNGRGMSPEELRQVFDLFYQGQQGIERAEGGLGVGLSLAQRLVALHGGRIEASSLGAGQGSEFVVYLPAVAAPRSASQPQPRPAPPVASFSQTILLVDDNVDAAQTLGELLTGYGHTVRVCHEPQEALAAIDDLRPDLAILDIGLPGMSGHELGERIRAMPGGARCRLVALSGYGQPADLARSEAAGFERHFVKPVRPEELLALVGER